MPSMTSVPDLFRRRARWQREATALSFEDTVVSYGELDSWSDAVAQTLIVRGVRPGDRVGVCLQRSPELIVALLAILKAGAIYAPFDTAEAGPRLADMIRDIEPRLVFCDAATLPGLHCTDAATAAVPGRGTPAGPGPGVPVCGDDLAALMFTSGSTGRPKAVMLRHRNIVNLVRRPTFIDVGPADCLLQLAPVAFDASTWEIWGALLNGARLAIAPPGPVLPDELAVAVRTARVTVLWLTAAVFHRQIDFGIEAFAGLRVVMAGGDVLSGPHVARLRKEVPDCVIINGYGPTEATTFSLCHRVGADESLEQGVPIGVPIQGVHVHVLDAHGDAAVEGELYIGGSGVTAGYWRRPGLTAERYVADRFTPCAVSPLYRSGDLVRRRPDGVLEFRGRTDDQVKLHGHRIEPGEVESVLAAQPQVSSAVVVVRAYRGEPYLVAYVVPRHGDDVDAGLLRRAVGERLPGYMVPAILQPLAELPIGPNGKVLRAALPEPDWPRRGAR
uniref:Non-ribosomal peptide synthetase n=1 Tax=uncultured bacterium AB_9 TaxID=1630012 RepID=A0A0E3JNN2_9BACT|nr:non-ribosomal peptide synthetase [uncultured bacterium AB_9]